jgi:penicillin-binding protein 1C
VRQQVVYTDGGEPSREEWFVAGTETAKLVAIEVAAGRARISSPVNGAIYAIDPDIPRERQRIVIAADGAQQGTWVQFDDGRRVRADAPHLWLPQPGFRRAVLLDAKGNEIDQVKFEVRGLRPGVKKSNGQD